MRKGERSMRGREGRVMLCCLFGVDEREDEVVVGGRERGAGGGWAQLISERARGAGNSGYCSSSSYQHMSSLHLPIQDVSTRTTATYQLNTLRQLDAPLLRL